QISCHVWFVEEVVGDRQTVSRQEHVVLIGELPETPHALLKKLLGRPQITRVVHRGVPELEAGNGSAPHVPEFEMKRKCLLSTKLHRRRVPAIERHQSRTVES